LNSIIESSPIGTQLLEHFEWHDVFIGEYEIVEILLADDFTEMLLLITEQIKGLQPVITSTDYQEIQRLIEWEYEQNIYDDNFDVAFNGIIERGKNLLERLPVIPEIPKL
jgi:hypothetical protein